MNKFTDLQEIERIKYIENLTLEYNLSTVAIEKDWWITAVACAVHFAVLRKFVIQRRYFVK